MIKELLSLSLIASLGASCTTIAPPRLAADDPANPEAAEAVDQPPPSLLAGSEPLARWLATNRVNASSHEGHGHGPEHQDKPQPKAAEKEHKH